MSPGASNVDIQSAQVSVADNIGICRHWYMADNGWTFVVG